MRWLRAGSIVVALLLGCGDGGAQPSDGAAEAGASDDATPDVDALPASPVDELNAEEFDSWVDGYCHHVCEEMDALCAGDPYQLEERGTPFDFDACESDCRSRIYDEPALVGNYHCHASSCEAAWSCIEREPLEVPEECSRFCAEADACAVLPLLEMGGGIELCSYLCAGGTVYNDFGEQARCFTEALGDSCDAASALGCVPFVDWQCQHICGGFGGHDHGGACSSSRVYRSLWEDGDACATECSELDVPDAVAVEACIHEAGCGDEVAVCWPPPEPEPACASYCAELLEICPRFDYPTPALCEAWCGQAAARTEGWPSCAASVAECPSGPAELVWCPVADPAEGCEDVCARLLECDVASDRCINDCTELADSDPDTFDEVRACIGDATDCDAVVGCIP